MSAHGSGAFAQVLREVGSGLTVPLLARVHILRELAYDLEALSERFAADGLPLDEARRRASEALVPDAGALHALERVHAPAYKHFTAHVSSTQGSRCFRRAADTGPRARYSAAHSFQVASANPTVRSFPRRTSGMRRMSGSSQAISSQRSSP